MSVRYDSADHCSGGPQPGLIALRDFILPVWPMVASWGIYNCRNVRGSSTSYSVHAEGRALDIRCNAFSSAERLFGDQICHWLIHHAELLQIQHIIWNGQIWKPGRGWAPYSGASAHRDHVYVEMNRSGAAVVHELLRGGGPAPSPVTPPEQVDAFRRAMGLPTGRAGVREWQWRASAETVAIASMMWRAWSSDGTVASSTSREVRSGLKPDCDPVAANSLVRSACAHDSGSPVRGSNSWPAS